jgi:hypothetical protein
MKDLKEHWEKIYKTKELKEVSWYQEKAQPSLDYIQSLKLDQRGSDHRYWGRR